MQTKPMITEDVLLAFWTIVFLVVGAIWAVYEARRLLLDYFYGEVLPPPSDECRILRSLPDDEVGLWHHPWQTIEGGGPYDWARIEADLERVRQLEN